MTPVVRVACCGCALVHDRVMDTRSLFALSLMLGASAGAAAFDASVTDPDLTITVPALPSIALAPQPAPQARTAKLLSGSDGTHAVAVAIEPAAKEVSTRECAGTFLRTLVQRAGMPSRDNIYRAPLDERTFLVIYLLDGKPKQVLHAHLLAAASAHCVDAHFSRDLRSGEDIDDWRKAFAGAAIEARAR
jgi:hypothetical protein